uniref:Uncharacterized protein n=1 Tax=Arundo donax TaxID=35708 RepID=A0A0A9FRF4_ARUDO
MNCSNLSLKFLVIIVCSYRTST